MFREIDGNYHEARLINNQLILITEAYINRHRSIDTNKKNLTLDDILPFSYDKVVGKQKEKVQVSCNSIKFLLPRIEEDKVINNLP
jgi:hypothetical protein